MTQEDNQHTVAYYTLGCKLNFAETSAIGKILLDKGFRRALPEEKPELVVVNTCSVTETADKKARSLIRRLARQWSDSTIIVTGCYAQLKPDEVASLPGVAIVLGSNEKLQIAKYIDDWSNRHTPIVENTASRDISTFMPSCERGERTRYWLKVQDGCDYYCTYCTIPFARGRSRSGRIDSLVAQAREAAEAGGKEIVLTGVNIGCFGQDTGESFFDLLKALDAVAGIKRYRISSIEPNLLTEEIIDWIAEESRAFMPHFHIPLQSGSDKVLRLMNRRYDTSMFASRINYILSKIPGAFIGVDVIAGARGETPEEWRNSVEFIKSLPVTRLHIFPYSERPGTAALRMQASTVEAGLRHRRVAELQTVSDKKLADYMTDAIGNTRPVLWEHMLYDNKEYMTGLTDNYLRVVAPAREDLLNKISMVRITGISSFHEESVAGEHIL